MVASRAGREKDGLVATAFSELIGRQYKLGGCGCEAGESLDCWGLINEYVLLVYGCALYDLSNQRLNLDYVSVYKNSPEIAFNEFISFLNETFSGIAPRDKKNGDIIHAVCDCKDAIGIYGGSGNFLITSPETDCAVMDLNNYKIIKGYRWQLPFH